MIPFITPDPPWVMGKASGAAEHVTPLRGTVNPSHYLKSFGGLLAY